MSGSDANWSGELLRHFRKRHGLTQVAFSELLGIERTYLARLETGAKRPSDRLESDIKEFLDSYGAQFAHSVDPRAVCDQARPQRGRMREAPVVSWGAIRAASSFLDIVPVAGESIGTCVNDPNAFAVVLEGESMEPEFHPGDRIVVAPHLEPRSGDAVLGKAADVRVFFRWFERTGPEGLMVRLSGENSNYGPMEISASDLLFCYPMLEFWQTLERRRPHSYSSRSFSLVSNHSPSNSASV